MTVTHGLNARRCLCLLALTLMLGRPLAAAEATLPPELDGLLQRAAAQTDLSALNGMVVGAIAARPELGPAILARVEELAPDRAAAARDAVRQALGEAVQGASPQPPPVAPAQVEPADSAGSDWSGKIRVGGGADFGKTNRQTLAVGIQLRNDDDRWRHDLALDVDFIRNDADTLQRDIESTVESRYTFNHRWFSFGRLRYEDERPSPFEFRTTEIAGLGYRVIDSESLTLDVQAGPGLRQTKLDSGDMVVNEVIGLLSSEVIARLSDTSRLTSKNEVIVGTERTTVHSRTALAVSIIWSIDAELSLTVDHDTKLPGEEPNTDVKSAVALVYGF